jgi:superfamily I DNA/RNA helicase
LSLTEEQRRVVDAIGSVVVVAGAGTGKTHMLTERYLHHLSEDGLSPLEVVAVTFTEKAAEELRSRVRERVRGRLSAREDLLAELEAAQISTIHALCARVCREHPEEAGVPADFRILDELRGRLWTADRLADAMDDLPQEHYRVVPYPLMQGALEALFSDPLAAEEGLAKGLEGWRDLIEEARETALLRYLEEPALKEARVSQLDAAKEVLRVLLSKRRLEPPTTLLRLADYLTGYTAVIANLPGAERREADWRGFVELVDDLERGSDDTFTVVRWLRQLHEAEAQVPRPPIEAGDAVSLMTIHAAKGLEWPVVVTPDLARAIPSTSGVVAFDPEMGVSVDFGEENGQPALHRLIRDKKARLEVDETRRVYYVAPTRARDHLILTGTGLTERLCGLTILQPGLEMAGIPVSPVPFDQRDAQPPELPSPLPAEPAALLLTPAVSGAEVAN